MGAKPAQPALWGSICPGRDMPKPERTFIDAVHDLCEQHGVQVRINEETRQCYFDTDDVKKIEQIVRTLEIEFGDCFE